LSKSIRVWRARDYALSVCSNMGLIVDWQTSYSVFEIADKTNGMVALYRRGNIIRKAYADVVNAL